MPEPRPSTASLQSEILLGVILRICNRQLRFYIVEVSIK